MTSVGYATLSVIPSSKGFGAALSKDIDPQLADAGHKSGAHFGKLLGGAAVAAAGLALAGIGAVLKTGVQEAMDASKGIAQLEAGIKSTGGAAGVTVGGLTDLAASIQLMSGQTDDSIVASEQLLLTFTNIRNVGADKIFDRATLATANMAAKMGGDAAGAAVMLGKALNDPIGGMSTLGRAGVQFTDAQKASITAMVDAGDTMGAQKLILGELETQFGGAAEAAGKSLPGSLQIAKRKFEDVSQSIAEKLIPVVLPALLKIADVVTEKIVPALGVFFGALSGNSEMGEFDGALRLINNAGVLVRDMFVTLSGFITGTVIPAIQGFVREFKNGEGAGGKFRDVLTAIYENGIKPVANFIVGTALPAVVAFVRGFKNGTGVGGGFKDFLVLLYNNAVKPIADFLIGTAIPAVQNFIQQFKDGEGAGGKFRDVLTTIWNKGLVPLFNFITTTALPALKSVETWILANVIPAINAWAAAMSWMWTNVYSPVIGFIVGAIQVWAAAAGWLWTNILSPYITAFTTLWTWMWSNVIKPVVDFIVGYFQLMGAVWSWVWTNVLSPTIQALATAFTWVKDRIGANFELIKAVVSLAVDTIKSNFQTVIDFFRDAPGKIGGFFSKIGDTISSVFKKAFNGIASLWNNSVGKLSFTIPDIRGMPGRGDKISMPKIPYLDKGGLITSPTIAMIGERRPEVVIPLEELGKHTGGPGKSQTINIYGVQNVEQLAAEMPRIQARFAA